MKLETYLRYGGHQNNRASLASVSSSPSNEGRKMPTTLRNVKKMIAFIKQVMHLKYLRKEMWGKWIKNKELILMK